MLKHLASKNRQHAANNSTSPPPRAALCESLDTNCPSIQNDTAAKPATKAETPKEPKPH